MIRIDDTLLEEIGLIALPKEERDQLLRQIYETLEMRVGMRLAERMTEPQLGEFERFIDTNDEAGGLSWLETNLPAYKQVVADELEKLKSEIKQDSSKIIEAMQVGGQGSQPETPVNGNGQPAPFVAPQTQNIQPQPDVPAQFRQETIAPSPQQNVPPPPASSFDQDQQPPTAA